MNAEAFAGFSNWRVPTRDELLTIVDLSAGPPLIDRIFGPTQASFYWSSTEIDLGIAWVVLFSNGNANLANKVFGFHVRAVRAGP